jgi:hypothetical protein
MLKIEKGIMNKIRKLKEDKIFSKKEKELDNTIDNTELLASIDTQITNLNSSLLTNYP